MSDTKATPEVEMAVLRLIPEFDGSASTPVTEWLEKLELVCSLRGVSALEEVIPLRLTGGAFSVYQQLPAGDKKDANKIKAALISAFGSDAFSAYEDFTTRRLRPGESVDVFLADLRRLATSFGGVSDKALSCALVAGLPETARQGLRASSRIEALALHELVARARAVLTDEPPIACAGRATAAGAILCYECGAPNHYSKDCLQRRRNGREGRRSSGRPRSPKGRCFRCGVTGHRAASCPGNGEGEPEPAQAFSPPARQ